MVPIENVGVSVVVIVKEFIADVFRQSPTILSTVPDPLLSPEVAIRDVLFVLPAYENISTVTNVGFTVLVFPSGTKGIDVFDVPLLEEAAEPLPAR